MATTVSSHSIITFPSSHSHHWLVTYIATISIKPTKSYFNYSNVRLLDQQVNFLGLTTSDKKLKAVRLLDYPKTLGALEYYLGLTEYLKSYIYFYAQLALLLQALKTNL